MLGYSGRFLKVDLSERSTEIVSTAEMVGEAQLQAFLGGRGLGAKLLWDQTEAGLDPLSPESPLFFLTGPLTGLAPGGAHTCLAFKSPQTGITWCHSTVGGHWGAELKAAGFDGVSIKGKVSTPVYLNIKDGAAQIKEAGHLWGKGTYETEAHLLDEAGDRRSQVLCIGPAGENGVLYSGVHTHRFHAAARAGGGCLMGSKGLKAVVVRGTGGIFTVRPAEFDVPRLEVQQRLTRSTRETTSGLWFARFGTFFSNLKQSDTGDLDVRNYREGYWEEAGRICVEYDASNSMRRSSCFSCPVSCMHIGKVHGGKYNGTVAVPDFDSTGTIGPGCLVNDLDSILYMNALADDLGMDTASLGNVTGFAMECYEKGLLSRNDLGGVDLKWGDVEAILALWDMIVRREGIGDLLSQGVRKAAEKIGQGSEKFAMHAKGLEMAGYLPNGVRGLQYAVGDRGGCHHFGVTVQEQMIRGLADSFLVCSFHMIGLFGQMPLSLYLRMLNAATGWNITEEEAISTAQRILTLGRCYNIREGMVPLRDDVLPDRAHTEPLTKGARKGSIYEHERFLKERGDWYKEVGCDSKGVPRDDVLEKLGLEFVIPSLCKKRT